VVSLLLKPVAETIFSRWLYDYFHRLRVSIDRGAEDGERRAELQMVPLISTLRPW
jgi:hypothetical protein